MNPNFPTWYREIDLEPTEEMLKKRWAAIETIAKEATTSDLEEIIRFFLTKGNLGDCASKLNASFQKTDAMFVIKNNERELVVLSGTVLIRVVDTRPDLASFVCLGMNCYSFYVSTDSHPLQEIIQLLKSHLRRISKEVRAYKSKLVPLKALNLKPAIEGFQAAAAEPSFPKLIETDLKAHLAIQGAWQGLRQAWTQSIVDPIAVLAEETELLWVLQCGYLDALESAVYKMQSDRACLILADQLASSTHFVPGPLALPAMIEALTQKTTDQGSTKINLISAIFESDLEWRKSRTILTSTKLAPIDSMLIKSTEVPDRAAFLQHASALADGSLLEEERSAVEIAIQFYNELLLAKLLIAPPA